MLVIENPINYFNTSLAVSSETRRPSYRRPDSRRVDFWPLLGSGHSVSPQLVSYLGPRSSGTRKSLVIGPSSVDPLARPITDLIRIHAINGSAHIIGHSFGAQIAIRLGSTDLDVVNSVFISGFEIFFGTEQQPPLMPSTQPGP
ncbi:Alpha/beta hydrolase fold-1 [Penicillium frequentans]|nr:Alpha/beta hydrolase fold-1 [Penicillium glabrum]